MEIVRQVGQIAVCYRCACHFIFSAVTCPMLVLFLSAISGYHFYSIPIFPHSIYILFLCCSFIRMSCEIAMNIQCGMSFMNVFVSFTQTVVCECAGLAVRCKCYKLAAHNVFE